MSCIHPIDSLYQREREKNEERKEENKREKNKISH